MLVKYLIFIFSLISLNGSVNAQFLDTLHEVFNHKSSIDARLESRYSFIDNELISVRGVRLGVAYQRKMRIGGGISWLNSMHPETFYETKVDGTIDTVFRNLKFTYLCYYVDFVFYKTKRWQLSVPIQAGTGLAWWQKQSKLNFYTGDKKHFFILYEPGITVQYKIFRWFGLGADVAYRFTALNNKKIGEKLNSPTYSLKILIWFDQLYFTSFPKSKITQKFGSAIW